MNESRFRDCFQKLTGNPPFPWQQSLYNRFIIGDIPTACTLPTGLGKTSIIPIWLIALVQAPHVVPRRLAYVVNRRTVVDQATDEVENIRMRLSDLPELNDLCASLSSLCSTPAETPLAISTLRGQYADNAEWTADPARPAVITGTVDMIGSRLLFSAYGAGFKRRPTHAALLGQDTLLVHDEAHLEPAFQKLLEAIEAAQQLEVPPSITNRPMGLRVMALTATPRNQGDNKPFTLTDDERKGRVPIVKDRLLAKKGIAFHSIADDKKPVEAVASLALVHKDSGQAILVYLRTVDAVQKVADAVKKKVPAANIATLTGTMRGLERDTLVAQPAFQRFLPPTKPTVSPSSPVTGTVYLVSTSAGEVGINITADHLVCDLTPFDSMAQRFGRVNRFGKGDALIDVVHPETFDDKPFDDAREKTLELLRALPLRPDERHDASPQALGTLIDDVGPTARDAAFTPPPTFLETTDILFDAWSLTSVTMRKDPMPGRPPVADWLHGIAEWEPPQTNFAWREEVELLDESLVEEHPPSDVLDDYPLKPHEQLHVPSTTAVKFLSALAERMPDTNVWLQSADGTVDVVLLKQLARTATRDATSLCDATVILPPGAGGLTPMGMLDDSAAYQPSAHSTAPPPPHVDDVLTDSVASESGETAVADADGFAYDVADEWYDSNGIPLRGRFWNDDEPPVPMRVARVLLIPRSDDINEDAADRWTWYVRIDPAVGTDFAREEQSLPDHLAAAERHATQIVNALHLNDPERTAVILAAKSHDLGKNRALWQQGIGNREYASGRVLAKSNGRRLMFNHTYRHEFGSLLDIQKQPEFQALPPESRDLVLHLIAAHHGRARPHFPSPPDRNEAFDPNAPAAAANQLAIEVPRRFARLQRKYGRWGLAWLETLVRSADVMASRVESSADEKEAVR